MASMAKFKGKGIKRSGQGANVGMRCHLEWLQQVTDLLSAANLSRLGESCFGHLLGVADIQFQGQVCHILVRNHLLVDNPNRLRFLIHDKVHEFGPTGFALITGLKFSRDYDLPKSSGMYDVCFTNKRSLKFVDILAAFKQECEISGGDFELSLKLAFLFLLYGIVLMRDRNDTNIQMQFVHLVNDIEKFNDYPWGHVSYEYLVKATLSRKEVLEKQLRQGKKPAYDAFGFLMALQVWAYEVILDLASHCAHKIEGKEQVFLRILRWTAPEFFQYDYLMRFFPAEPVQPRGLLPPTEEEWRHLERLGLQQIHVSPSKLYPEVVGTAARKRKARGGGDREGEKKNRKPTTTPLRRSLRKAAQPPPDFIPESKTRPLKDSDSGRFLVRDREGEKKNRKPTTTPLCRSSRKAVQPPSDSILESKTRPLKDSDSGRFLARDICSNVWYTIYY